MTKYKKAFTLAEVLITLGIIGVVAALTLPNLIANHRKKEVVTKLERVYTVMNQALKMSEAEYGDMKSWVWDGGPSDANTRTYDQTLEWYNTYLGKHLKTLKVEKNQIDEALLVYFPDGSILHIQPYIHDMYFYINKKAMTNGIAGVNKFFFNLNPVLQDYQKSQSERWVHMLNKGFEPYAWRWDGTREGLINGEYGCSPNSNIPSVSEASKCAKLIQYDGWQIKDDYPFKF